MGARQAPETYLAIHLWRNGASIRVAAKAAGVAPSTLFRAIRRGKLAR